MKSEYEKMIHGECYNSLSEEILIHVRKARVLTDKLMEHKNDEDKKSHIIKKLFGSTGEKVSVYPPFTCDHGKHIPACSACQICIEASSLIIKIFRKSRIHLTVIIFHCCI